MLRVDPSLFSNVITTVQRTGSLPGGSVRGLSHGVVIEGLNGVQSFGSDIAEARKEFELGRLQSALERVKQIEMHFNGILGRWNSTVGSVISSARQGQHKLSLQKLNEVKSAQAKMQQLTGPATKALRDLVTALEHAVAMEGRSTAETAETADRATDNEAETAAVEGSSAAEPHQQPGLARPSMPESDEETQPDTNLLGRFAENYRFGCKLQLQTRADKKVQIVPRLAKESFYFVAGFDPPRVVRIREIRRKAVLVLDTHQACEILVSAAELKTLIRRGVWTLVSQDPIA